MESVLLAETESDGRPAGARRSHSLRPSQPGDQAARSSQPEGPGIFPPGSAVIVSPILLGMRLADRRCPDKNLLRQNCFHLKMNGSSQKPETSNPIGSNFRHVV
jgi:hypothetical protein